MTARNAAAGGGFQDETQLPPGIQGGETAALRQLRNPGTRDRDDSMTIGLQSQCKRSK